MTLNKMLKSILFSTSVFSIATALPLDDFSDIQGPYCETIGCCQDRHDGCSVPVLGTLCYCDEFCSHMEVEDCCPDFYPVCRNINITTTIRPFVTTRRPQPPPQSSTSCLWNGRTLFYKQKVKDNCNICECTDVGGRLEMLCERNVCLIDTNIIESVNLEQDMLGWRATNYSEFWGRTLDEGVRYRLGTLIPQAFVMHMNPVRRIYDIHSLPRSFDSETKWPRYISGIQDQGWCGASWAISTAAVASDRYAIVSKGLEEVKLSAQNLLSCDTMGQQSCEGGHLDRAWSFTKKFGLVDEECFPYVAENEPCTIRRSGKLVESGCKPPRFSERTRRYSVGPAYRLGNETDIMYEIIKSGPVQATMKVYHDFYSYEGGIYRHTDFGIGQQTGYLSVRIVGWGEEYTSRGVQKYWKVANSWGSQWGENGYFKILKGVNECEVESFVLGAWPRVDRKILLAHGQRNSNRI
ncbi:unnamed protein product [Acanthoscelides obtectus]|uniref:SMB domain-containing protein n=3 Tax=Acanthoscelides obtectus TaxID=200917 RepID=A0A9P0PZT6_ACAOB|nr:unnamed protein product [Acanthoscelides obtectus]CAK1675532.1 Tubulointerstitial nephritis antigen-like [Acanthoscelides obtectus]